MQAGANPDSVGLLSRIRLADLESFLSEALQHLCATLPYRQQVFSTDRTTLRGTCECRPWHLELACIPTYYHRLAPPADGMRQATQCTVKPSMAYAGWFTPGTACERLLFHAQCI